MDAQAKSNKIFGAQSVNNGFNAFVAAIWSVTADAQNAQRQIDVVMDNPNVWRLYFVKIS